MIKKEFFQGKFIIFPFLLMCSIIIAALTSFPVVTANGDSGTEGDAKDQTGGFTVTPKEIDYTNPESYKTLDYANLKTPLPDGFDYNKVAESGKFDRIPKELANDIPTAVLVKHISKLSVAAKDKLKAEKLIAVQTHNPPGDLGPLGKSYDFGEVKRFLELLYNGADIEPGYEMTILPDGRLHNDGVSLDLNGADSTTKVILSCGGSIGGSQECSFIVNNIEVEGAEGSVNAETTTLDHASSAKIEENSAELTNVQKMTVTPTKTTIEKAETGNMVILANLDGNDITNQLNFGEGSNIIMNESGLRLGAASDLSITKQTEDEINYFITDAQNVDFDGNTLNIEHAGSILVGNVIFTNVDSLSIPFNFNYSILDVNVNLIDYEDISFSSADYIKIGNYEFNNIKDAKFIISDEKIVFANLTNGGEKTSFLFESPLAIDAETEVSVDKDESINYLNFEGSLLVSSNDVIETYVGSEQVKDLKYFTNGPAAVGTPVTRRPLHRSLRAVFPHRALQLCSLS